MEKMSAFLTAALFAGGLTTAALAEQQERGAAGGTATRSTSVAAQDFMGEHSMKGTISKLDQSTGKVSLTTEAGPLELHFPPAAISNLSSPKFLAARHGRGRNGLYPPIVLLQGSPNEGGETSQWKAVGG